MTRFQNDVCNELPCNGFVKKVFIFLHKSFSWDDNEEDISFVSNGQCGARPGGKIELRKPIYRKFKYLKSRNILQSMIIFDEQVPTGHGSDFFKDFPLNALC